MAGVREAKREQIARGGRREKHLFSPLDTHLTTYPLPSNTQTSRHSAALLSLPTQHQTTNKQIASLSFGAARDFQLRETGGRQRRVALQLSAGDVLVMAGSLQRHWQHCVPKRARAQGPRVSLTFRRVVERGGRPPPGSFAGSSAAAAAAAAAAARVAAAEVHGADGGDVTD